jgi:transposase
MEVRMAERGRPKAPLVLSEEERDTLSRWARRPNSPQALALRAKIVLACAEGKTNEVVAAELRCSKPTVGKWRSRFVAKRLRGLADEYRPGVPRTITDDHVEAVVVKTLTEKPKDATHWSTRAMAKATGMSQPTISRIWKAFGLKPWLEDTFKLSSDPLFIDKVRDIVGLYLNPPVRHEAPLTICVAQDGRRDLRQSRSIL